MDFYTYYLRRLENRPNQITAMNACRDMAMKLFDGGPMTWAISSGAALLCAMHEAKMRPGTDPVPTFDEVEQALFAEIQGMRLDLESDIQRAIRSTGCGRPRNRNNHRKER